MLCGRCGLSVGQKIARRSEGTQQQLCRARHRDQHSRKSTNIVALATKTSIMAIAKSWLDFTQTPSPDGKCDWILFFQFRALLWISAVFQWALPQICIVYVVCIFCCLDDQPLSVCSAVLEAAWSSWLSNSSSSWSASRWSTMCRKLSFRKYREPFGRGLRLELEGWF